MEHTQATAREQTELQHNQHMLETKVSAAIPRRSRGAVGALVGLHGGSRLALAASCSVEAGAWAAGRPRCYCGELQASLGSGTCKPAARNSGGGRWLLATQPG
jgi:hypothetical protein